MQIKPRIGTYFGAIQHTELPKDEKGAPMPDMGGMM
jgi:hypothetical protein